MDIDHNTDVNQTLPIAGLTLQDRAHDSDTGSMDEGEVRSSPQAVYTENKHISVPNPFIFHLLNPERPVVENGNAARSERANVANGVNGPRGVNANGPQGVTAPNGVNGVNVPNPNSWMEDAAKVNEFPFPFSYILTSTGRRAS